MTSAKRKELLFLGGVFALAALILFLALPRLLAVPAVTALLLVYLLDAGFSLWAVFLRRFGKVGRGVGKGLFVLLGTLIALGALIYTAAPAILFQPRTDPRCRALAYHSPNRCPSGQRALRLSAQGGRPDASALLRRQSGICRQPPVVADPAGTVPLL